MCLGWFFYKKVILSYINITRKHPPLSEDSSSSSSRHRWERSYDIDKKTSTARFCTHIHWVYIGLMNTTHLRLFYTARKKISQCLAMGNVTVFYFLYFSILYLTPWYFTYTCMKYAAAVARFCVPSVLLLFFHGKRESPFLFYFAPLSLETHRLWNRWILYLDTFTHTHTLPILRSIY